jgi:hypothetical protein
VADSKATARGSEALVIPLRIDGELANEQASFSDDTDGSAGHEEGHGLVFVGAPQGDVTEAAEVAQGDGAIGVRRVLAHAEVGDH